MKKIFLLISLFIFSFVFSNSVFAAEELYGTCVYNSVSLRTRISLYSDGTTTRLSFTNGDGVDISDEFKFSFNDEDFIANNKISCPSSIDYLPDSSEFSLGFSSIDKITFAVDDSNFSSHLSKDVISGDFVAVVDNACVYYNPYSIIKDETSAFKVILTSDGISPQMQTVFPTVLSPSPTTTLKVTDFISDSKFYCPSQVYRNSSMVFSRDGIGIDGAYYYLDETETTLVDGTLAYDETSSTTDVCTYPIYLAESSYSGNYNIQLRFNKNVNISLVSSFTLNNSSTPLFKLETDYVSNDFYDSAGVLDCNMNGALMYYFPDIAVNSTEAPVNLGFISDIPLDDTNAKDGSMFLKLLGDLKKPMEIGNRISSSHIFGEVTWASVTSTTVICNDSTCESDINGYIRQGVTKIIEYCDSEVSHNVLGGGADWAQRAQECYDFINLYNSFYTSGEDNNVTCYLISNDLRDKIKFFLNIIMFIGPTIALMMGSLDFVKVIAIGDANKELKIAFRKFILRIIMAGVLLLAPIIAAFMLDLFVGSGLNGYDTDNPFCDTVNW